MSYQRHTVYCKSFEVETFRGCRTKLSFARKLLWLDGNLAWLKPIAQAISLEKFHGTDRSAKTTKLFHLERFAIYSTL